MTQCEAIAFFGWGLMICLLRGALKGEPSSRQACIGQGSWCSMVLARRARATGKRCKQA